MPPLVGLSLDIEEIPAHEAARPLFEEGLVGALEVDIDNEWGGLPKERPAWAHQLLDLYAGAGTLYGHGVWLSVLNADRQERQEQWFERLAAECKRRPYRHVTEHFGCMAAGPFLASALLPMPYCSAAVEVGRERMERLSAAAGVPVGLELSANHFAARDVIDQGPFLEAVLAPVDGLIVLDVHNLYTQAVNSGLPAETLLETYPLQRVREIHVSGGSWARVVGMPGCEPVRLDSHDGPVPHPVLGLLRRALERCPACEVVFVEQRGGLPNHLRSSFAEDYRSVHRVVQEAAAAEPVPPGYSAPPPPALLTREQLFDYQVTLLAALVEEVGQEAILGRLRASPTGPLLAAYLDGFDPRLVEVMSELAVIHSRYDRGHARVVRDRPVVAEEIRRRVRLLESAVAP